MDSLYPLIKLLNKLPSNQVKTAIARMDSWWQNNGDNATTILCSDSSIRMDRLNAMVETSYLSIFSFLPNKYEKEGKLLFRLYLFHQVYSSS